jgi:hypothetical protein
LKKTKEKIMKRTITVLLAVAAVAALVVWAPTMKHGVTALPVVHAQSGCGNATLTGNYVFTYIGFNSKRNNKATELPIAVVGVAAFDGAGNASFSYNFAFDGSVGATTTPDVGTYAVNSDCTFTMSDPVVGNTWAGAIVGGGTEWDAIVTSTGFTVTTQGKKQ